jgi:hypothetical protein
MIKNIIYALLIYLWTTSKTCWINPMWPSSGCCTHSPEARTLPYTKAGTTYESISFNFFINTTMGFIINLELNILWYNFYWNMFDQSRVVLPRIGRRARTLYDEMIRCFIIYFFWLVDTVGSNNFFYMYNYLYMVVPVSQRGPRTRLAPDAFTFEAQQEVQDKEE